MIKTNAALSIKGTQLADGEEEVTELNVIGRLERTDRGYLIEYTDYASADENRTVILVSHNLEQIRSFCSTVLWLSHGEIRASGDPDTVIGQYLRSIKKK